MSQENVEVVVRAVDAFSRGDGDDLVRTMQPDVVIEENDPDFGFIGLDPVYRGHEGARRWLATVREPWDELEGEVEEARPVGDDVVLLIARLRGRGTGSGLAADVPTYQVFNMRAGRIARRRIYAQLRAAMQAAGVEE
jgi:ketosteroid isomerase-like protein